MLTTRTYTDSRVLAGLSLRGCETICISLGHHGHGTMQRRGGAIVAPHESGSGTFATCRGTPTMSVDGGWSQSVDATLYPKGEMECALMGHGFHRGFTVAEKTELWDRWKRGESLKAIGRAFGKQSSSIYFLVVPHGGIRPAERRRSRLALTLAEREVISRGVAVHQSARSIARLLGRSPSTVSREMGRNGGCDRYRAALADENAWARARRPKCCKLANSPRLRRAVAGKLRLDWSPEQIAGWLKRTHPEDGCNQVSHETIYRSLFVQTRGVLKKELLSHLRSKRSMRRSRPVDPNGDRLGHIKDIISIRQRPAAVEDRAVPGLSKGHRLVGALASPSEQSGSPAKRTTT